MNSAVKPALTSSSPQNPQVPVQLNKSMHPQGAQGSYGQSSSHMPQSLVNLPQHNPSIAHTHPNPAHQTNHYSLNVPNTLQHYTASNPSNIPSSNHPVPNASQPSAGGQVYSPNKSTPYTAGYQPNLGHPPNQHSLPPVSQSLPATHHTMEASPDSAAKTHQDNKPHANGTMEVKTCEHQENHVSLQKDKSPASSPKVEKKEEESSSTPSKQKIEKDDMEGGSDVASRSKTSPETSTEVETKKDSPKMENADDKVKAEEESDASSDTNKSEEQQQTPATSRNTTPKSATRKSKTPKSENDSPKTSKSEIKTPQKSSPGGTKGKRTRIKTQHYQSPLPEIEIITKISSSNIRSKSQDDKLIVFYKNEFLAVRNSEGGFYVCRAVQNIYKSSPKILIRWLSQDKNDKSGEIYAPDFYDHTDFDCILTNINLTRVDKGRYRLPPAEKERTDSILKRSLAVEKGEEVASPSLTEEHPDGIDLSLYKEESQLKKGKKGSKRRAKSPLKSGRKSNSNIKSPDQSKVRKVATKTRRAASAQKLSVKAKKNPPEPAKPTNTATSRTDRAKRRSDNQNSTKVTPVVDQKKARVLAKVARKVTASKSQPAKKMPKSAASTSKVQKAVPKASAKKTKRSSRK